MGLEDAALLARLASAITKPSELRTALRTFEALRIPRTKAGREASVRNRDVLHLPEGAAQQERDQVAISWMKKQPISRNPYVWSDLETQRWIYGYDTVEATKSRRLKPSPAHLQMDNFLCQKQETPHKPSHIPSTLIANPQTHAQLLTHANLLHLLHVRNRNQHRRGTWYRHFSSFRREVRRLCGDLDILPRGSTAAGKHGAVGEVVGRRRRKRRGNDKADKVTGSSRRVRLTKKEKQKRLDLRLGFWKRTDCMVKWYIAFTTIITDSPFCPLGLVLLGLLARVAQMTGMTEHYKVEARDVENMEETLWRQRAVDELERYAKEESSERSAVDEESAVDNGRGEDGEDVGVLVKRGEIDGFENAARIPPKKRKRQGFL